MLAPDLLLTVLMRWGKRCLRRWLMPTLVQFPLSVERRVVELRVLLVLMLGFASKHLRHRWSRCSLR